MEEQFIILTKEDIVKGLRASGVKEGQYLFVHTSLSSFGHVIGGAETIISALIEVVGEEGTIMMPGQTWRNLDPSIGVHWEVPEEHWQLIRDNHPAYNKAITPVVGMGAVAALFANWPGVERSDHPARSVCAYGKYAKHLTEGHDLSNIFGQGSPVDKLYQLDGYVLLLGVFHNKNTSIHLAETKADFTSKKFTKESSAIMVNGVRKWVTYETQEVEDEDFEALGQAYEKEVNLKVTKIGKCDVRLFKQKPFVDYAVKWLEANRD